MSVFSFFNPQSLLREECNVYRRERKSLPAPFRGTEFNYSFATRETFRSFERSRRARAARAINMSPLIGMKPLEPLPNDVEIRTPSGKPPTPSSDTNHNCPRLGHRQIHGTSSKSIQVIDVLYLLSASRSVTLSSRKYAPGLSLEPTCTVPAIASFARSVWPFASTGKTLPV
jgi:hypothetical protein